MSSPGDPTSTRTTLASVVDAAVQRELGPVRQLWEARSQDMLDVLADAAEARAHVRAATQTIRLAAWLGVLALVTATLGIWLVLDRERIERRVARQLDDARLERLEQACRRRVNEPRDR